MSKDSHGGQGSILFFSGGSALKEVSRKLAGITPNTVHIISTFDSGGSTAELRRAFNMPAPGDLRLRLSTLATLASSSGCEFFERRLGGNGRRELLEIIDGESGVVAGFRSLLEFFIQIMPADFDLRGAALGNLILAADYLKNGRSLYESTRRVASALGVCGTVLPVSEDPVHLAVRLENGALLVGQHNFTGKNGLEPSAPIRNMFFCRELDDPSPAQVRPGRGVLESIAASSLICYPVGSFYSSVLANLRVEGVGEALRKSPAKKVYMPNPGRDPESLALSLEEHLELICRAVRGESLAAKSLVDASGIIDFLLVDSQNAAYAGGIPTGWCSRHGVKIMDCAYVEPDAQGRALISSGKCAALLPRLASICNLA